MWSMIKTFQKSQFLSCVLVGLLLGFPVTGAGTGSLSGDCLAVENSAESEDNLPELKPLTPKMHKVEPYKAGVQQNAYIKSKKAKKKKKKKTKRKKLKANTRKNSFGGKQRKAGLDNSRLQSSLNSTRLNSNARRGIGIIGVKFISYSGFPPVINRVFPGTPAAQVGLRPKDKIVAVDGIPTSGLTKEECYDLIVGSPNTPVTLSIRRGTNFMVHTMNRMDFTELTDPSVRRAYGVNL